MVSLSIRQPAAAVAMERRIRSINLRTDLPSLVDLLEAAFAETMDAGGRAAMRQMRAAGRSPIPWRWWLFSQGLASGVRRSLVWVEDGRVLGNLSIYHADLPHGQGRAWVLANIAVMPEMRRRGIASQLLAAALARLRQNGARHILLQVDEENEIARRVYRRAGFSEEAIVCQWARRRGIKPPPLMIENRLIQRPASGNWRAQFALAARTRPPEKGGIGWLRPLVEAEFHDGLLRKIRRSLTGRWRERRVAIGADGQLRAAIWLDRVPGRPQELTLFHDDGAGEAALLELCRWALRRQPFHAFTLEHPASASISSLLRSLDFRLQRTVVNMRWQEK